MRVPQGLKPASVLDFAARLNSLLKRNQVDDFGHFREQKVNSLCAVWKLKLSFSPNCETVPFPRN
jgi:hypothetical protein